MSSALLRGILAVVVLVGSVAIPAILLIGGFALFVFATSWALDTVVHPLVGEHVLVTGSIYGAGIGIYVIVCFRLFTGGKPAPVRYMNEYTPYDDPDEFKYP